MKPVLFFLTCANEQEAQKVTDVLLEKRLVACVKMQMVTSHFLWKGAKESANEMLLIMDSIEEQFDDIYAQIKQLHSYSAFVLLTVPIIKTSDDVRIWLRTELRSSHK